MGILSISLNKMIVCIRENGTKGCLLVPLSFNLNIKILITHNFRKNVYYHKHILLKGMKKVGNSLKIRLK